MYKGIKKLAELILESEEKFLTGQDEQEIYLGSLLNTGVHDEIWVSEDGEHHTVMIGNKKRRTTACRCVTGRASGMSSEITVDCECTSEAFGAGKRQSADREK